MRRSAVGGAVLCLLVACSDAEPTPSAEPSATVATAPATTTTTDPYAVPAVIDEAYVNRVLAGLDAVVGDVVRMVVRTRTIPREGVDRLRAVYGTDEALDRILNSLSISVSQGLSGFRNEPGDKKSRVVELLIRSSACVFAKISRDFSAVSVGSPATDDIQWVVLRRSVPARDAHSYNSIGWTYYYEGYESGRQPPTRDYCAQ